MKAATSPRFLRDCGRSLGRTAPKLCTVGPERWPPVTAPEKTPLNIPGGSITDFLWNRFDRWPDRIATVCSETGRSYTYGALQRHADNLAAHLRHHHGLHPGDVIALLLPNTPEYPLLLLGALRANLTVTTINPNYSPEEISTQITSSGARAVLVDSIPVEPFGDDVHQVLPKSITLREALGTPETTWCTASSERASRVALLPYSSGTTGLPKGVELSHGNILANLAQTECLEDGVFDVGDPQTVVPAVLPLFHIYGMTCIMFKAMALGGKVVTVSRFTPGGFARMLKEYRPHNLFVVPPIVMFLGTHESITPDHLSSVVNVVSGAAPLGAGDAQRLLERAGRDVPCLQGYGLTESSPAITFTRPETWREQLGGVGAPLPGTECIVVPVQEEHEDRLHLQDPSPLALGPLERGELLVRGPQIMQGYRNLPSHTSLTLLPGGWLRTGDSAHYTPSGTLHLEDRLKELIKVKGLQVAPAELEALLRSHPGVQDAAVVGVKDKECGEVPKAFLVARNGVKRPGDEEVMGFVAGKVAKHKRLKGGVVWVEEIPKSAAGKILRRVLREKDA